MVTVLRLIYAGVVGGILTVASACSGGQDGAPTIVCGYTIQFADERERVGIAAGAIEDFERLSASGQAFFVAVDASLVTLAAEQEGSCQTVPAIVKTLQNSSVSATLTIGRLSPQEVESQQHIAVANMLNSPDEQGCVLVGTGNGNLERTLSDLRVGQLPYMGGVIARAEILDGVVYIGTAAQCEAATPVLRALESAFQPTDTDWQMCSERRMSACGYPISSSSAN